MKKTIAFILSIMILTISANAAEVGGKYISSEGACVMDFETGKILYEHDGYTPKVPASMTKIMAMYCVYEALENGEITPDTIVPISKKVYTNSHNGVYMLPLEYNQNYRVDELMDVVVTYSSSSATVALAELLGGGSEAVFTERMNQKAQEMGIDARYYDSWGLEDNKISPVSMATLARRIITDYPDILVRSSRKSVMFRGQKYKTSNRLLDTYLYPGADGLKTGTKSSSGYCFCGTAKRNGERIITVTMKSASNEQRFTDTISLLDFGFEKMAEKNRIYFTDMRTFINDSEVPTFVYKGDKTHSVVIAEDLAVYGFDVVWEEEAKTLSISYNPQKEVLPIALDYYRDKNGQRAFDIIKPSAVRVLIEKNGESYELSDIYNVGGYMCISADEFQNIYECIWNSDEMAMHINTKEQ